ncbi:MAG: hypothetical protein IPF45_04240 [Thermomonas sp.]|nr:hypothetical protein [Thermomonas sp.]
MKQILAVALLASAPLSGVQAHGNHGTQVGIGAEIRHELADARKEVRIDLAKARRELETDNLRLDKGLRFGQDGTRKQARNTALPQAEITPRGDFLIDGKPQAIDGGQRRQLLAYRGQVIGIAKSGIDIGQRSAEAALDAVGNGSLFGLVVGAMTGSLERRIERLVRAEVEPGVRGICRQLPALLQAQQRLASSLAQFRPYATLEAGDVDDCEKQVRRDFASL